MKNQKQRLKKNISLRILSHSKKRHWQRLFFLSLFAVLLGFFSGCIRFVGTAGLWKKGPDDEYAKSKSVTLDTQDIVQPNRAKGSITMDEEP